MNASAMSLGRDAAAGFPRLAAFSAATPTATGPRPRWATPRRLSVRMDGLPPARAARPSPPKPLPPQSGVLFDVENVIYDGFQWRVWLFKLVTRMGLNTRYRLFYRAWEGDWLGRVCSGQIEYWEALRRFLVAAGMSHAQVDEVQAAGQTRYLAGLDRDRPFPGVAATLARLTQSGLSLGVLCNTSSSAADLSARLQRHGLKQYFRVLACSCDLGAALPDAGCYAAAIDRLALPAHEVAYVGHRPTEIGGARAVGLATIAINYDADTQADTYLDRFDQLPAVLRPREMPTRKAG